LLAKVDKVVGVGRCKFEALMRFESEQLTDGCAVEPGGGSEFEPESTGGEKAFQGVGPRDHPARLETGNRWLGDPGSGRQGSLG
jgi:hypothetical protein